MKGCEKFNLDEAMKSDYSDQIVKQNESLK